jgi:hypothetical protein
MDFEGGEIFGNFRGFPGFYGFWDFPYNRGFCGFRVFCGFRYLCIINGHFIRFFLIFHKDYFSNYSKDSNLFLSNSETMNSRTNSN